MSLPVNQVILGDCIEVMAEWPENSIDCIVCDPPYGIRFMNLDFDKALPPRAAFEQMIRVLKPGALAFIMSSPRQDVLWRMLAMLEGVGFQLRQSALFWIFRTGFPKSYDVSKGIDRRLGLERKIIGRSPHFSPGRQRTWGDGVKYGTQKGTDAETDWVSEPASDLAKKWSGWKSQTGLKPAAECILMVNKPRSEKNIVENVLKWGVGAINVDNCRIPFKNETIESGRGGRRKQENWGMAPLPFPENIKGRFPANLLIKNGALDRPGETTKTGNILPHHKSGDEEGYLYNYGIYGKYKADPETHYVDEGSPYRFFDLDAWAEHNGFLDVAKPSRAERNFGLMGKPKGPPPASARSKAAEGRKNPLGEPRANYHPCVKPVRLMAYLITLGCPPDGVVVDPFLGSGTTCIAAKKLRRKWIGIEINPEYAEIAEARINIKGPLDQFLEDSESG